MKKIYSAMECGCYRYEGSDQWEICEYHSRMEIPKNKPLNYKTAKDSSRRHFKLYVLKLANEKYYVGLTARKKILDRINEHRFGVGAKWALLHKPVRVIETEDLGYISKREAEKKENNLTLEYMKKYGTQNVRGGKNVTTGLIFLKRYNILTKEWFFIQLIKLIIFLALIIIAYTWFWYKNYG